MPQPHLLLILSALGVLRGPASQDQPTAADPDVLVVTPTRQAVSTLEVPYTVQVVDEQQLAQRAYRTLPQALRDVPGVLVQETSHGQGSPYLRGFTGRRNLFLVDGIRLNNSVFRDGPNEYWNTVDGSSLGSLEVVKGPSSVLYGSDAAGGTVNAIPRKPYIWDRAIGGKLSWRVASGESSHQARLELGGAMGADTAWLLGLTRKDFGDVEAGGSLGEQPGTGYDEWDGDLVVEHWLNPLAMLTLAHYHVDQNDVPRTHRTQDAVSFHGTSVGSDLRREFDHGRDLSYARIATFGDLETSTTLSYQRQRETRFRTRSSGAMEEQGFDVGTLGLSSVASRDSDLGRLTSGFEWYRDEVDSFRERFASQTAADDIQGPVGDDASYASFGVFLQDELPLSERTDLTLGARWTHNALDADSVRDPVTNQRIELSDSWQQLTGSVRLHYELGEAGEDALFGGLSQGFRAPNLADLTRFDSAGTDEFEIPATDLDSESFVQLELGAKHAGEQLAYEASVFYTRFEDLIARFPTGNVNGEGEREVTKANVGDGHMFGLELGAAWDIDNSWSVFGDLAWIDGDTRTFEQAGGALVDDKPSRLAPTSVHAGLRWEPQELSYWGELLVVWAGDADRLSLRDQSDTSRIPLGGTEGHTVLDLRGGWQVSKGWEVLFGIENLADVNYRTHGSGSNRVGRNIYLGFTWSF